MYWVQRLVKEFGLSVNKKDLSGNTPLHVAVQHGFYEIAKWLISNGADINAVNEDTTSILMTAIRNGHRSCTQLLIEKGVDVNTIISTELKKEEQPQVKDEDDDEPAAPEEGVKDLMVCLFLFL